MIWVLCENTPCVHVPGNTPCRKICSQKQHRSQKDPIILTHLPTPRPKPAMTTKCVRCEKLTRMLCLACMECNLCQRCQSSHSTDFCASCFDDSGRQEVIEAVRLCGETRRTWKCFVNWQRESARYVWRKIRLAEGKDPRKGVTYDFCQLNRTEVKIIRTLTRRLTPAEIREQRKDRRELLRDGVTHEAVEYLKCD